MGSLIKADIFFFITAIAIVVLTLTWVVFAVYVVLILRDLRHVSKNIKTESDLIAEDLSDLREALREEGGKLKALVSFFAGLFSKSRRTRRKAVKRRTRNGEESPLEDRGSV